MNMAELHRPPDTREHHIRMARIFLHQARQTAHRSWAFTLLTWAAERRLKALRFYWTTPRQAKQTPQQLDLFAL